MIHCPHRLRDIKASKMQFALKLQSGWRQKTPNHPPREERQHPAAPAQKRPCSHSAIMDSVQHQHESWAVLDVEDWKTHITPPLERKLRVIYKIHYP